MSSDILEGLEDGQGSEIDLTMNVYGHAFLGMTGHPVDGGQRVVDVHFHLTPDAKGFELAEKIEGVLREWRRHVQETKGASDG